jgi:hypothetical protein
MVKTPAPPIPGTPLPLSAFALEIREKDAIVLGLIALDGPLHTTPRLCAVAMSATMARDLAKKLTNLAEMVDGAANDRTAQPPRLVTND